MTYDIRNLTTFVRYFVKKHRWQEAASLGMQAAERSPNQVCPDGSLDARSLIVPPGFLLFMLSARTRRGLNVDFDTRNVG
jgi:hypothetical protein